MFHWLNLYVIRYHRFLRNRKKRMRGGSEWKQHKSGITENHTFRWMHAKKNRSLYIRSSLKITLLFLHLNIMRSMDNVMNNVSKTALQLLEPWRTIPENYFNQMEITDCSNHEQTSRYTLPVFINILIPAYMIVFDVIGIEHKT